MTEELKPCPFCGGEPLILSRQFWTKNDKGLSCSDYRHSLICSVCKKSTEEHIVYRLAVDEWNRRTTDD